MGPSSFGTGSETLHTHIESCWVGLQIVVLVLLLSQLLHAVAAAAAAAAAALLLLLLCCCCCHTSLFVWQVVMVRCCKILVVLQYFIDSMLQEPK